MLNLRTSNGHFSNPEAKFSISGEVKNYRSIWLHLAAIGRDWP